MTYQINTPNIRRDLIETDPYSIQDDAKAEWRAKIDADYEVFAELFAEDRFKLLRHRVSSMAAHGWRIQALSIDHGVILNGRQHNWKDTFQCDFHSIDGYYTIPFEGEETTWDQLLATHHEKYGKDS